MRVGILTLAAGRQAGGPETYEVECIQALARLDTTNEYFVYCTGRYASEALGPLPENITVRVLRPSVRAISLTLVLPGMLRRDRIDLFHAMYAAPPFPFQPMVSTMHGLVNFIHPEFFSSLVLLRLNRLMRIAVERSEFIVCVSEHVRQQVHQYFRIPLDRLAVTYLGVSPRFRPIPKTEAVATVREKRIRGRYLLYAGKRHPAKNLARLLGAFSIFRRKIGADIQLVLAGARAGDAPVDRRIHELGLQDAVVQIPWVSPTELPALYSAAEMFLFPSLFESFGLPVVEAMACGTPVLCSDVAALPEIASDAALLVDPHSEEAIADGMFMLYGSEQLCRDLRNKGLMRAQTFTWQNCGLSTLAAYRRVLASPQRVVA
jgi:glycosyltransferase involved in cell wall biosynthesis